jgi:hypothetical protein
MTVLDIEPTMDIPLRKQGHNPRLHKVRSIAEKWPSNFRNRDVFSEVVQAWDLTFAGIQLKSPSPGEGKRVIPAPVRSPSEARLFRTLRRTVSEQRLKNGFLFL